jgi:hypothetical protein
MSMRVTSVKAALGAGALAAMLTVAGCHKSDTNAGDPANANLAPVNGQTGDTVPSGAPQQGAETAAGSSSAMPPAPPADTQGSGAGTESAAAGSSGSYADQPQEDNGTGEDAEYAQAVYADSPPPELPEYQQPECPGPNYIWTPGYWNYAQDSYYWVPGVWVTAPFVGALWTPGYWGYDQNRYAFHHGYWGPHIGFYGGVNYGYGYGGNGYEGGYWNRNQFYYNSSVTRINNTYVHNTYIHNVSFQNNTRVAYNGGRGGLNVEPNRYDQVAAREQHFAALPAQQQHIQQARENKGNFYHGGSNFRPATLVATRAIAVRTVATPRAANLHPIVNRGGFERPGAVQGRSVDPRTTNGTAARTVENRNASQPNRPQNSQAQQRVNEQRDQHTQPRVQNQHVQPQQHVETQQHVQNQHVQTQRTQQHVQTQHVQPQQHVQTQHTQPQQHVQTQHTQPQQHVQTQRVQPQQHVQAQHTQPQHSQARPQEHAQSGHEAPHGGDDHGHQR